MEVEASARSTGEAVVDARVGHAGTRIDLDDVGRTYRIGETTVTALEGVNLHVDEAAFVAILGPSGSGKTTLLNVIGALDRPTSGNRLNLWNTKLTPVRRNTARSPGEALVRSTPATRAVPDASATRTSRRRSASWNDRVELS